MVTPSPGCFPINVHSKFVVSVIHLENMAPNDLFDIHGTELPCTVDLFVELAGCFSFTKDQGSVGNIVTRPRKSWNRGNYFSMCCLSLEFGMLLVQRSVVSTFLCLFII